MSAKPIQVLQEAIEAAAARAATAGSSTNGTPKQEEVVVEFDENEDALDTWIARTFEPETTASTYGLSGLNSAWRTGSSPLYDATLYPYSSNKIQVSQFTNGKYLMVAELGYYVSGSVDTKKMYPITSAIKYTGTAPLMIYSNPAYKIYLAKDALYVYFFTDEDSNPYSRLIRFTTCFEIPEGTSITVRTFDSHAVSEQPPTNPSFHTLSPPLSLTDQDWTGFQPIKFGLRRNEANANELSIIGHFIYMGNGDIPASTPTRILPEDFLHTKDDTFLYQIYQSEKYDVVLTAAGLVLWSHKEPIPNGTEIKFKGTVYLIRSVADELEGSILATGETKADAV